MGTVSEPEVPSPSHVDTLTPATPRALEWIEQLRAFITPGKRLKHDIAVRDVHADGDTIVVTIDRRVGHCTVMFAPRDDAQTAFAKSVHAMVWYRLHNDCAFDPALGAFCRALLARIDPTHTAHTR